MRRHLLRLATALTLICLLAAGARADVLVLKSGTRYKGKVVKDKDGVIKFRVKLPMGTAVMTFTYKRIRSVTVGGKTRFIKAIAVSKPASNKPAPRPGSTPVANLGPKPEPKTVPKPAPDPRKWNGIPIRTSAEVEALIAKAAADPSWLASTTLNFPKTLRLDWTRAGGGWKPNVNMGAHLISIVYRSPNKWKYGAKLLQHTATVNRGKAAALKKSYEAMGRHYSDFLGDPARAAYWWRKAGAQPWKLADCYRRLGSREMAVAQMRRIAGGRIAVDQVIHQWAMLGDQSSALRLVEAYARSRPDFAYRAAGRVYRFAGKFKEAAAYFDKVLALKKGSRQLNRNKTYCRDAAAAMKAIIGYAPGKLRDGTYSGTGKGFRGNINVSVTVSGGKITAAKVTSHRDDWSGRSTFELPRRIVEQNGLAGVDLVSRATYSSDGTINGAARAIAKAMK